jgi:hypothetical protein
MLVADSVKPNKLKHHIQKRETSPKNPSVENLMKLASSNTTTVSPKALLASYQVSYRTAQNKKPHTSTETMILPAAIDMVQTIFSEKCAQKLPNIPLSNNTVS